MAVLEIVEKLATIFAAIGTLLGLGGIYLQIKGSREDARRRALEIITNLLKTETYNEDRMLFISARENSLLAAEPNASDPTLNAVRRVLNVHELVALYVLEGLVDETVVKKHIKGWFIEDWRTLDVFVGKVRKRRNNQALYMQYEMLVERWTGK